MATRIIEFEFSARADGLPVVPRKITAQTALTATGTSAQSAAVGLLSRLVLVQSDEAVYVAIGTNPTATTNDYRIVAGGEQFFEIAPSEKVAVRT